MNDKEIIEKIKEIIKENYPKYMCRCSMLSKIIQLLDIKKEIIELIIQESKRRKKAGYLY